MKIQRKNSMERYIESSSFSSDRLTKVEVPSDKISELADHTEDRLTESILRESSSVWEVPISRYDSENANGRVYPRPLWEKVLREQKHLWEGSPMLANHPADDGDGNPADICGVWVGARMGEDGYVYGHLKPSGILGRDLDEHLQNGLRAGTSSSGFGELLEDGMTVNPDTFTIERLSDWVLTPSQGTYFTYDGVTKETRNDSDDSRYQEVKINASDSQVIGESAENKPESVVKEKTTMKLTKLEEKKFRRDIEQFLESASSLENPQERLAEFEEILSYFEEGAAPDLREKAEAKIEEQRALIEKQLSDVAKLNEFGVKDVDDLKETLGVIKTKTTNLVAENRDWEKIAKSLAEKLGEAREDLETRPTSNYANHLRKTIKALHGKNRQSQKDLIEATKKLEEETEFETKKSEALVSELKEEITDKSKEIDSLTKQVERLQIRSTRLEEELKGAINDLEEYRRIKEAKPIVHNPAADVARYVNFREGDKVDRYWADLVVRHGADIKPYEEKIRSAKTLREAQSNYLKILDFLNESNDVRESRIPESVSISMKERKKLLEEKGINVQSDTFAERLPVGWR